MNTFFTCYCFSALCPVSCTLQSLGWHMLETDTLFRSQWRSCSAVDRLMLAIDDSNVNYILLGAITIRAFRHQPAPKKKKNRWQWKCIYLHISSATSWSRGNLDLYIGSFRIEIRWIQAGMVLQETHFRVNKVPKLWLRISYSKWYWICRCQV